jgi:hypothetical protein
LRDAHLRFDLAITFEDSKKQKLSSLFVPAWPTDDTSEPVQFVVDATKTRLQQAEEGKLPASWVGLVSGVRRPAIFAQHSDPSTARLPWRPAAQTIELIEGDAPSGRSAFIWTLAAVGLWTYAAWAIVDFRKRDSMGRWIGNAAGGGGAMLDGSELDR